MLEVNEVRQQRKKAKDEAGAILEAASKQGRGLTLAEQLTYDGLRDKIEDINLRLAEHAAGATIATGPSEFPLHLGGGENWAPPSGSALLSSGIHGAGAKATAEQLAGLASAHSWIRRGVVATDTPLHSYQSPISTGLAAAIPTIILDALRSYTQNDAFARAGSTIYDTPDTVPLVKPIIEAGADADTFVEGQSATDSKPFSATAFTFGGVKYSRLVKVSEESLMNSALNLPQEILSELGASVANTFTKAISTAMLAALEANHAACFVNGWAYDTYRALLATRMAIPPRFEDPGNKWMMSRADLLVVRNARDDQQRPLFDPNSGTIFGFGVVVNDNLNRVVFGQWSAGAYVRKSPFVLQRLTELYSSTGHIGFKATQFLDSKFLASVDVDQPLVYTNLETAGS